MVQNRTGVRILADAAGLSYERVKLALYHIMMETTQAPYEARFLAARLQWPEPAP